jgi:hypothetical protein
MGAILILSALLSACDGCGYGGGGTINIGYFSSGLIDCNGNQISGTGGCLFDERFTLRLYHNGGELICADWVVNGACGAPWATQSVGLYSPTSRPLDYQIVQQLYTMGQSDIGLMNTLNSMHEFNFPVFGGFLESISLFDEWCEFFDCENTSPFSAEGEALPGEGEGEAGGEGEGDPGDGWESVTSYPCDDVPYYESVDGLGPGPEGAAVDDSSFALFNVVEIPDINSYGYTCDGLASTVDERDAKGAYFKRGGIVWEASIPRHVQLSFASTAAGCGGTGSDHGQATQCTEIRWLTPVSAALGAGVGRICQVWYSGEWHELGWLTSDIYNSGCFQWFPLLTSEHWLYISAESNCLGDELADGGFSSPGNLNSTAGSSGGTNGSASPMSSQDLESAVTRGNLASADAIAQKIADAIGESGEPVPFEGLTYDELTSDGGVDPDGQHNPETAANNLLGELGSFSNPITDRVNSAFGGVAPTSSGIFAVFDTTVDLSSFGIDQQYAFFASSIPDINTPWGAAFEQVRIAFKAILAVLFFLKFLTSTLELFRNVV